LTRNIRCHYSILKNSITQKTSEKFEELLIWRIFPLIGKDIEAGLGGAIFKVRFNTPEVTDPAYIAEVAVPPM
jgi:hypothetical protein